MGQHEVIIGSAVDAVIIQLVHWTDLMLTKSMDAQDRFIILVLKNFMQDKKCNLLTLAHTLEFSTVICIVKCSPLS